MRLQGFLKMRILLKNIGSLVTGDIREPIGQADSILVEDGYVKRIGYGLTDSPELEVDCRGCLVAPGLIDSHVHPVFGEYSPPQEALAWIRSYLHGGVTSMVSAGELHLPGLKVDDLRPSIAKSLAILAKHCYSSAQLGAKVYAGTLLLVPSLDEGDFDELSRQGVGCVKFIFYNFKDSPRGEAEGYVEWSKKRGMVVKIHSGGVSRSGFSQIAGWDVISRLEPDVVAHANGGPIPMPIEDVEKVMEGTNCYIEITSSGNPKLAVRIAEMASKMNSLHRLILGTDTPGGTGIIPRGMLRNLLLLSSIAGIKPEVSLCMATGNTAKAHRLDSGFIKEGKPADILVMDAIPGSVADDALTSISVGDLPAVSMVIVDGRVLVKGRSLQTPPPKREPIIR